MTGKAMNVQIVQFSYTLPNFRPSGFFASGFFGFFQFPYAAIYIQIRASLKTYETSELSFRP